MEHSTQQHTRPPLCCAAVLCGQIICLDSWSFQYHWELLNVKCLKVLMLERGQSSHVSWMKSQNVFLQL